MTGRGWLAGLVILAGTTFGCANREMHPAKVTNIQQVSTGLQAADAGVENGDKDEDQIVLTVTVFILDDHEEIFSSQRTAEEILKIQNEVNDIWQQASIQFQIDEVRRVTVPITITAHIIRREMDEFFYALTQEGGTFETDTDISGFYVKTLKGDNGLHAVGYPAFFTADDTLSDPARTVAHELGHVLGLTHSTNSPARLMQSGTSGIFLSNHEILLARQNTAELK